MELRQLTIEESITEKLDKDLGGEEENPSTQWTVVRWLIILSSTQMGP